MAWKNKKLLAYEDMLEKFPNLELEDAFTVFTEATPELTEQARIRKKLGLDIF